VDVDGAIPTRGTFVATVSLDWAGE